MDKTKTALQGSPINNIILVLNSRATYVAVTVWVAANLAVYFLANGSFPFDMPAMRAIPFEQRIAAPTIGLLEIFILMVIVCWLTRKRVIPDMAARAPDRTKAARETTALVGYAVVGQIGGWLLGLALGYRPFSFHIAGTLVGTSNLPGIGEMWTWALYNFAVFAVAPYCWFRNRYSASDLNLRSTDKRNDLLVVVVVVVLESLWELVALSSEILHLSPHQLLVGSSITFFFYFIGTVLPTMIFIYAILLPRYLRLTGSATVTVLLGGITYASLHLVEGWSRFDSVPMGSMSILIVFMQYFGPGMFKSVVTLRTGNAWVHAFAYHAIAPHVVIDTPLIVKALGIR